jgi:hypothetical protein
VPAFIWSSLRRRRMMPPGIIIGADPSGPHV